MAKYLDDHFHDAPRFLYGPLSDENLKQTREDLLAALQMRAELRARRQKKPVGFGPEVVRLEPGKATRIDVGGAPAQPRRTKRSKKGTA